MSEGIIRRASANSPLWWNALPRSRALSCQVSEKSTSWCSSRMASWSGVSMSWTRSAISAPVEHRRVLERAQASVDPDPRLRAADEEQVRTLLIPQNLQPGIDSFVVGGAHSATSVSLMVVRSCVKPKRPAPRAGRFGSAMLTRVSTTRALQPPCRRVVGVVEPAPAVHERRPPDRWSLVEAERVAVRP